MAATAITIRVMVLFDADAPPNVSASVFLLAERRILCPAAQPHALHFGAVPRVTVQVLDQ
jgi:hypothetical protein